MSSQNGLTLAETISSLWRQGQTTADSGPRRETPRPGAAADQRTLAEDLQRLWAEQAGSADGSRRRGSPADPDLGHDPVRRGPSP